MRLGNLNVGNQATLSDPGKVVGALLKGTNNRQ
jgi:hypothetical protein